MRQYLDLLRTVLDEGTWQDNRTGVRTRVISGAMLRFEGAAIVSAAVAAGAPEGRP